MVNVILANVGTVVCFRTGNPADERLMLPLFSPYIQEGDIANLPPYNFYMRASAIKSQEPFSGETLLPDNPGNEEIADQVIEASRQQYAKKYLPPEPKEKPKEEDAKSSSQTATKEPKQTMQGKDRLKRRRKRNTKPKIQKPKPKEGDKDDKKDQ